MSKEVLQKRNISTMPITSDKPPNLCRTCLSTSKKPSCDDIKQTTSQQCDKFHLKPLKPLKPSLKSLDSKVASEKSFEIVKELENLKTDLDRAEVENNELRRYV